MVKKKYYHFQLLCYFLSLLIITSCQNDKLQGSWFVVDIGRPLDYPGAYAAIYSFKEDSLIIDYIGWKRESHFISSKKNGIIKTESLADIKYRFNKDSLILNYDTVFNNHYLGKEHYTLSFLPFQPEHIQASPDQLKENLKRNYWTIQIKNKHLDQKSGVVFLEENNSFPKAKKCEVEEFTDDWFEDSYKNDDYYWLIGEEDGQLVLTFDDSKNNFYPSEFFITKIQDDTIWANAWKRGDKYDVLLISSPLVDAEELESRRNHLIGEWHLESVDFPEVKDDTVERENIPDSMIIMFEEVGIDEESMDFVIKEEDLKNKQITYEFNEDSSFQIKRGGEVIQEGGWKLNRSGKSVNMNIFPQSVSKKLDYRKMGLAHDFLIRDLTTNSLDTEQFIYIYENDFSAPKFYRQLQFSKAPDS